ncbi:unnamed protein product, partial [Mycena citricolor]
ETPLFTIYKFLSSTSSSATIGSASIESCDTGVLSTPKPSHLSHTEKLITRSVNVFIFWFTFIVDSLLSTPSAFHRTVEIRPVAITYRDRVSASVEDTELTLAVPIETESRYKS